MNVRFDLAQHSRTPFANISQRSIYRTTLLLPKTSLRASRTALNSVRIDVRVSSLREVVALRSAKESFKHHDGSLVLGVTSRLVFANCHLASDASFGLNRSCWGIDQIISKTDFDPLCTPACQKKKARIGDQDFAFRFGKLNFRLDSGSTVFQETTPGGFLFCTQEAYTV
ncbi:hypothetical protein E4U30_006644 [Claviceps sp. LM220 group G6]|nr:hypothetical protein E4U30_006644 [Claviceps sp. LM220 group G6]